MDKINSEFNEMVKVYNNRVKKATSMSDVLQFMLDRKDKIWFWSYEFMGKTSTGGFLSHRACARASDLAIHHPALVEDRKIGRFKVYRLKVENMKDIKNFIK